MTIAACIPNIPGKPMSQGGIAAYLQELLKLSPAEIRGVSILLEKRLSATVTAATDIYRVPADQDLVVFQIHSSYRSSALATEPALNSNIQLDVDGLEKARMSNCVVALQNKDRNLAVFDNRSMRLSAIRDTPIYFPANAPLLVPATHTLQADFSLQDTTPAVVGNAADYGIVLSGILIPKRV
jgi:hypothetical protein